MLESGVQEYDVSSRYFFSQTDKTENGFSTGRWILHKRRAVLAFLSGYKTFFKKAGLSLLFIAYIIYLAFAIRHNFYNALVLVVLTTLGVLLIVYTFIRNTYSGVVWKYFGRPVIKCYEKHEFWIKWLVGVAVLLAIVLYFTFVVIKTRQQLQSLIGMFLCIFIPWITCKNHEKIKWRPVIWGFGLQFVIGLLVLRWRPGYIAIEWLSDEINKFLFYSLDGAASVFGDPWFLLHPFAMLVVSLIVYIGAVVQVLYYLGLTQIVSEKLGWLMQITLKTTAIESTSIAANIFLSVLEIVLMFREFVPHLTPSELHTFLVGAHASIAGFAFGLFVLFGVNPRHLLTGAVMSAPAAVAIAKLNFPETEKSRFANNKLEYSATSDRNIYEAFANGAMTAGKMVAGLMIQIIAFFSAFVFLDSTLIWLGQRVGLSISINTLLGYIFTPVAFSLGIEWKECNTVASLLGLKFVANEFLSYIELGQINSEGALSSRSAAIATYAMCGFSSFGTLAMFVGVWKPLNTNREKEVTSLIPRVLMNANLSCYLTACIAALMYSEDLEEIGTERSPLQELVIAFLTQLPTYKEFLPTF